MEKPALRVVALRPTVPAARRLDRAERDEMRRLEQRDAAWIIEREFEPTTTPPRRLIGDAA